MGNTIKFPISKFYIFFCLIWPTLLFFLTTSILFSGNFAEKDLPPLILFDIVFLFVAGSVLRKYFIPLKKERTALELNEKKIIFHVSNISIDWDNVYAVRFSKKGMNSFIAIEASDRELLARQTKNIFKVIALNIYLLFYGAPIIIQTAYIEGRNSDIFEKVDAYWTSLKNVKQ